MSCWTRLGVIAGGGALPVRLAQRATALGRACFVARLPGLSDPGLLAFPGEDFGLGEMQARFAAFRAFGCDAIVFAGKVQRPNWAGLKLDALGLALLPKVMAAAARGDDALHQTLAQIFEAEGFRVIGPEAVLGGFLARPGALGARAPDPSALRDIAKGASLVAALGPFDVGQGCVVRNGLVMAVEAQEGTDAMLARAAALSSLGPEGGVLVKRPKPAQERRIDLPAIGTKTLEGAAEARLSGVAAEAGAALLIDPEAMREAADRLGLFVYGFTPAEAGWP